MRNNAFHCIDARSYLQLIVKRGEIALQDWKHRCNQFPFSSALRKCEEFLRKGISILLTLTRSPEFICVQVIFADFCKTTSSLNSSSGQHFVSFGAIAKMTRQDKPSWERFPKKSQAKCTFLHSTRKYTTPSINHPPDERLNYPFV